MSDSFIYVGDTGNSGAKLQSYANTINSYAVQSEAVTLVDTTGTPFGSAANPLSFNLLNQPTVVVGNTVGATVTNAFALDTTVQALLTNAQLRASPLSVTVGNFPATQPVSGTVSVSGSVEIANDVGNPLPVSGSVAVSNFPPSQAVTGTFFQATQPVSIAAPVPVTGTFYPPTQPVSATALPLPTGAATDASVSATNPYRGTTTIFAGAAGTVTVPSGARIVSLSAHSVTGGGGTVTMFGATIPVPANNGFNTGWDGLVGPASVVFASTDAYYLAINQ